jgi:hypothetical protein
MTEIILTDFRVKLLESGQNQGNKSRNFIGLKQAQKCKRYFAYFFFYF